MDSLSEPAGGFCAVYTVAPTTGEVVGVIGSRRLLMQSTTAAAAGIPEEVVFDFTNGECEGPVVRPAAEDSESLQLSFLSAPATTVSMNIEIEWVEE